MSASGLFPSFDGAPDLAEVFQRFSAGVRPLLEYHDVVLRGPSPLSVAERELIAAYVSALNGCDFCYQSHSIIARAFGVEEGVLADLVSEQTGAGVPARLAPLLEYVRKLTLTPARLRPADAEAVFAQGWDEEALHSAIAVCALFNLMNRFVDGHGVETNEMVQAAQRERHGRDAGEPPSTTTYTDYGRQIGVID